jgi:HD-like signal output (HDOD) protein
MVRSPEDLLKSSLEVSSLPMIYYRVNEAINHPNASMADIGKIISDDPGLTVRLLRLVNSAFYGFPNKIGTITQALVIIGTKQLCDLALATSIVSLFSGIPKEFVSMESFWRHSIACGIAAKTIATFRREANIERFLTAGMVHDIGRFIIYKKMGDQAREALLRCKSDGGLLFLAEREMIGFDHASLGGLLLKTWRLPPSLEETVMFHHKPQEARLYPVQTAVIHVADVIVNALQWGSSGEHHVPPLDEKAWEILGLSTDILVPTIHHLKQQLNDVIHSILGGSEG